MRYFIECSFEGTPFHGWQKQPEHATIQQIMENALQVLLRTNLVELTGCGRTDAGVHARKYFAHFDYDHKLPDALKYHWNAILPPEIAVHRVWEVPVTAHVRHDAVSRTYQYHMHGNKSPFLINRSLWFKSFDRLDQIILQQAAESLLAYTDFFPFCRSHSNVRHYEVMLKHVNWSAPDHHSLVFSITANRFLRGMVRMITGMCLNVALGRIDLGEVKRCLDKQILLPGSWSVPAHGLYLTEVEYRGLY